MSISDLNKKTTAIDGNQEDRSTGSVRSVESNTKAPELTTETMNSTTTLDIEGFLKATERCNNADVPENEKKELEQEKIKQMKYIVAQLVPIVRNGIPGWNAVEKEDLELVHMSGAFTNVIFKCMRKESSGADVEGVIIRVYGATCEILFQRSVERKMFVELSDKNIGIGIFCEFANGRIEKIVPGEVSSKEGIRVPETSKAISRRMAELHHLDLPSFQTNESQLLPKVHKWVYHCEQMCHGEANPVYGTEFYKKRIASLSTDLKRLEAFLSKRPSPTMFIHADIQYGNVLVNKEDIGEVNLIDFEYSLYGPRGYDFANHFYEWCYDYHGSTPHLPDESRYPSEAQRHEFIKNYLQFYNKTNQVTEDEVQEIMEEARFFTAASHFHWALWGYLQAIDADIDYDNLGFADARYNAFLKIIEEDN